MSKIVKTTSFAALALSLVLGAAAVARSADFAADFGSIASGVAKDATDAARERMRKAIKGDDAKKAEAEKSAKPAKSAKPGTKPGKRAVEIQ